MQYGYFDNDRREYVINRVDTPASWTNYIGVNDYCAVLNQTAGGYSFYKSPQYHRVTRFRPNVVPLDLSLIHISCKDVNNVPPDNGMPLVIISDGKISQWALQTVGVDEAWIDQVLIDNACPQDKVFLLTATKTREYYLVRKELA